MGYKRNLLSLLPAAVTLIIYRLTSYPGLAFWDCSEYILASSTLGIPHPPGNPLFLLIGRLATLILPGQNPASAVHGVSSLFSAIGIGLFFLIIVRLLRDFNPTFPPSLTYFCSILPTLSLAFSTTYWNTAGEAEVYNMALCFSLAAWLCMLRFHRERRLNGWMGMFFFTGLGLGCHFLAMIWLPVFLIIIIIINRSSRLPLPILSVQLFYWLLVMIAFVIERTCFHIIPWWGLGLLWGLTLLYMAKTGKTLINWPMWLLLFLSSSLMIDLESFLLFSGISLVLSPILGGLAPRDRLNWKIYGSGLFSFLLGLSVFITIPLRSALLPCLNMSEPLTWEAFRSYFERKFYGTSPLILKITERQSHFQDQIMAYLEMIRHQITDPLFASFFLVLVLLGGSELFRRRHRLDLRLLIIGCLMISSLGLVIYLNLPAGLSNPDHRSRDYFFGHSFLILFLLSGLGLAWLVDKIRNRLQFKPLLWILILPWLLLPMGILQTHRFQLNRSQNYIADDFAYNLLMTCQPNSILFTYADNDTYPLWALQQNGRFRPDLLVINITLLNTDWYIKQIRETLGLPITDDEIRYIHWVYPKLESIPIRFEMEDLSLNMQGRLWRQNRHYGIFLTSDYMILKIIQDYYHRQPIYFANTIPVSQRLVSHRNLTQEGLASRLSGSRLSPIDPEKMVYNFQYIYRYRSFSDSVFKSDLDMTIIRHYGTALLKLIDYDVEIKNYSQAEEIITAMQRTPLQYEWRLADRMMRIYRDQNRLSAGIDQMERVKRIPESFYQPETYTVMAEWCRVTHDEPGYVEWLERGVMQSRQDPELYRRLARIYKQHGEQSKLNRLMEQARRYLPPQLRQKLESEL
ncbi:MAG: DUF2723 domain-containing protein [Candidatus Delongbacteria bacterium]|nr:DUF2723 domain-containing protein [Candidatus Delongbacteria bacterium]